MFHTAFSPHNIDVIGDTWYYDTGVVAYGSKAFGMI